MRNIKNVKNKSSGENTAGHGTSFGVEIVDEEDASSGGICGLIEKPILPVKWRDSKIYELNVCVLFEFQRKFS